MCGGVCIYALLRSFINDISRIALSILQRFFYRLKLINSVDFEHVDCHRCCHPISINVKNQILILNSVWVICVSTCSENNNCFLTKWLQWTGNVLCQFIQKFVVYQKITFNLIALTFLVVFEPWTSKKVDTFKKKGKDKLTRCDTMHEFHWILCHFRYSEIKFFFLSIPGNNRKSVGLAHKFDIFFWFYFWINPICGRWTKVKDCFIERRKITALQFISIVQKKRRTNFIARAFKYLYFLREKTLNGNRSKAVHLYYCV